MRTFFTCLLFVAQGLTSYSFAQTATPSEAPQKDANQATSSKPTVEASLVGRWAGSLFGRNTGAHMSDDEIVISTGSAPNSFRVEYSGIGRFRDNYDQRYGFSPVETVLINGSLKFEAGRFTLDCKQESLDTLRCSKLSADGRGNQGAFKRLAK